MKIKAGFMKRTLAGQTVVMAFGEASRSFNGMVKLNETGECIWDLLASGVETEEEIVAHMAEIYEVDRAVLAADVASMIATLTEAGILV